MRIISMSLKEYEAVGTSPDRSFSCLKLRLARFPETLGKPSSSLKEKENLQLKINTNS